MRKKIAVLSDTHGLLRPEVIEKIENVDLILHAGDINKQEIIDRLEQIAPLLVVRGNNDKEWAEHLPKHIETEIEGIKVHMVHNKKDLPKDLSPYDLVVYGHSHKYLEIRENNVLLLNPGSCGKRRFDQEITFAILTIEAGEILVEKVLIPH